MGKYGTDKYRYIQTASNKRSGVGFRVKQKQKEIIVEMKTISERIQSVQTEMDEWRTTKYNPIQKVVFRRWCCQDLSVEVELKGGERI